LFTDLVKTQALYDPKRLRMLWALMNTQRRSPQPKLMGQKRKGQSGNLAALTKGMPNNLPGRSLRPPKIGGWNAHSLI